MNLASALTRSTVPASSPCRSLATSSTVLALAIAWYIFTQNELRSPSSTGQVNTLLHLSESNGYIAGDLKGPNDSRSISGSRSGETIQFYVEGGDRWSLVFSNDDTLVGTAVKPDGNTYALFFTR